MYKKALELAKQAHANQIDKAGTPYINHLLAVADGVIDETDKIVALLHDLVEDTSYTFDDLIRMGYPDIIVDAVRCITKIKGEKYGSYLERVKSNAISTRVKLSDLRHNMDTKRLNIITKKDLKRIEKYKYAVQYLTASNQLMSRTATDIKFPKF